MASIKNLYSSKVIQPGFETNYGVDFVIHFKLSADKKDEDEAQFIRLIEALVNVGFATEVRNGTADSLLIFLKIASQKILNDQVYRSRLGDWLHGARTIGPDKDVSQSLQDDPVTEAERLRLVFLLITRPKGEGGAGITPGSGPWTSVESIFPLHDHAFNRTWIQKMSSKYTVDDKDLNDIRDKFGEHVAFYFAFMQAYFRFLVFPAAAGFSAWMFLGQFSSLYALAVCFWSVIFFEFWKKKEVDLAVQWGTRGSSKIQHPRPQFQHEHEARDPVTGEIIRVYSPYKRLQTQLLQIPFAIACILVLGTLISTCNSLEIFINQVYDGPFKRYLAFIPTAILVVMTPTFSTILTNFAERLTEMENYETMDAHHAALVQKQFVLNFITSYMALFFTAFVYIPFGHVLTPYLDFWRTIATKLTPKDHVWAAQEFVVDPTRISQQMFYFTVTAQVVNFLTETVLPYVKRKVKDEAKGVQAKISRSAAASQNRDVKEEKDFLDRVRSEIELEVYDVTGDFREMIIQFGYLSLFSVAWPLTPCFFLINNWVELRSDAVKIAISSRRPIPWRADSIGPWIDALGFLSWLGTLTSAGIVSLCSHSNSSGPAGSKGQVEAWVVLLSVFLAEHFYLATQMVVRYLMSKVDSPGLQRERKEKYLIKKKLLEENLQQEVHEKAATPGIEKSDQITRAALEDEARRASKRGLNGPEDMFWQRQRGMGDTIEVGRSYISQNATQSAGSKSL
ncbi:calcium-activated chloride channel-domain-containing protein [Plectosphaerella cucumerina]|uniref:Calcium-activated chloride channel-domain-containing protein n=1 Tax=Plectosphaerella cucumerina TaxID=40658 RepID=A0A8K0X8Y4_9PEZI|nr:calcium-activated chloride channel-domain-containing protein [Plectosphaerella cucumerina]